MRHDALHSECLSDYLASKMFLFVIYHVDEAFLNIVFPSLVLDVSIEARKLGTDVRVYDDVDSVSKVYVGVEDLRRARLRHW